MRNERRHLRASTLRRGGKRRQRREQLLTRAFQFAARSCFSYGEPVEQPVVAWAVECVAIPSVIPLLQLIRGQRWPVIVHSFSRLSEPEPRPLAGGDEGRRGNLHDAQTETCCPFNGAPSLREKRKTPSA